jgi:hypothetical protein
MENIKIHLIKVERDDVDRCVCAGFATLQSPTCCVAVCIMMIERYTVSWPIQVFSLYICMLPQRSPVLPTWQSDITTNVSHSSACCVCCLPFVGSQLYIIFVTAKANEWFAHTISVVNHVTIFTLCIEAKAETLSSGGYHPMQFDVS